jgi:hypothetical protein
VAGESLRYLIGLATGEERRVRIQSPAVEVRIRENSLYGDVAMELQPLATPRQPLPRGAGPVARSQALRIGPRSLTLRNDMEVRFEVEGADSAFAVYRQSDRSDKWVHYPSVIEGTSVSTTARRPGIYAVMSDDLPPIIRRPVVARRLMYSTGRRIPEIRIALEDRQSGIDYSRCTVFRNGFKEIARWDPRAKKLFVLIRDENIMGTQALTVVAYDNVGHRSQLDVHVDIPRRQ